MCFVSGGSANWIVYAWSLSCTPKRNRPKLSSFIPQKFNWVLSLKDILLYRLFKEFKQIFLLNLSFQNILLIYLILSNIYKRTTIKQGTKLIILPVFQNCPKSVRRFSRNTHATSPAMSCGPIAAHRRRVRGQNSHLPSTTWWWVLATQHSTSQSLQWNITDLAGRSSSIYFMFPGRAEYKSDSGSAAISC